MKKHFDIVRKCALFSDINDVDLNELLKCLNATVKTYDKRDTILYEGDTVKHIGIVLSGCVQLERTDYEGNRSIVNKICPSEIYGEAFACAESCKIPMDVIAAERSEIMLVDCSKVVNTCCNSCGFHNKMIYNLLKIVSTKNILLNQKADITAKRTTRDKLMAFLMAQKKKHGKNSFVIPYDRQELADYLEVDRSGLSAEISKLRKEGIIESNRSQFKILKQEK